MGYRPQYAYPTPQGFRDEQFHYSFDYVNTPLLSEFSTVPPNTIVPNIPLVLQTDAPFLWRGFQVQQLQTGAGSPVLAIQFKDPWGNYLSTGPLPIGLYPPCPGNASNTVLRGVDPMIVEPEIRCPAGSIIWVWLQNTSANNSYFNPRVILYGVKRFREPGRVKG